MSAPASSRRRAVARAGLVVAALGAAAAVPLAAQLGSPAGAVTIDGARSLSDSVVVKFPGAGSGPTTDYHILGFNDFHGNLQPAALNIYGQYAGGAAYLAKLVKDKQAAYAPRVATVMAGDNIGAAPLENSLVNEEPATIINNLMGVDFASVGNHEFDKGKTELARIQSGGCAPTGCNGAPYALPGGGSTSTYPGASFQYLSANVIDNSTGNPFLPAYGIKTYTNGSGGTTKIGFIGEVLQATPTIVTPSGVAGLTFQDEITAANTAATALKAAGAQAIVLVIHQGGFQSSPAALNGCTGNLAGSDILPIVQGLDPAIGVIVSGHTHAEYRCTLSAGGTTRLITSAAAFGRILTDITLTVDDTTGEITTASANNLVVSNATTAPPAARVADTTKSDPTVAAVVSQYVAAAAPLANQVIGSITADLTRTATTYGETSMGDVIADSQLEATAPAAQGGAVIAFMNPGGVRADLVYNQISGGEQLGEVTYGEAFTVQPFGNSLVTKTMTGAQIRSLLEQQFPGCGGQTTKRILQISSSLSYEQDPTQTTCSARIGAIRLNGTPIDPAASYRVTMNSFLATGGDGFTVFNQGTNALGGAQDIDALKAFFAAHSPIAPPAQTRIVAIPPAAVVPEASYATLLTVAGLLVVAGAIGGVVLVQRRRTTA